MGIHLHTVDRVLKPGLERRVGQARVPIDIHKPNARSARIVIPGIRKSANKRSVRAFRGKFKIDLVPHLTIHLTFVGFIHISQLRGPHTKLRDIRGLVRDRLPLIQCILKCIAPTGRDPPHIDARNQGIHHILGRNRSAIPIVSTVRFHKIGKRLSAQNMGSKRVRITNLGGHRMETIQRLDQLSRLLRKSSRVFDR